MTEKKTPVIQVGAEVVGPNGRKCTVTGTAGPNEWKLKGTDGTPYVVHGRDLELTPSEIARQAQVEQVEPKVEQPVPEPTEGKPDPSGDGGGTEGAGDESTTEGDPSSEGESGSTEEPSGDSETPVDDSF